MAKKSKKSKLNLKPASETPVIHKRKTILFFIVLFSIPVLFFVLLEAALRIGNYGFNNEQWVETSPGKLELNPDIAYKFFYSNENLPGTIHDLFDKEKKQNSYRVFVLGESSAAGFPYMPLGAFSRYLQKRLELVYPRSIIEVVNIGMTAINSYALLDFFPGVLEQKPDLILIYTGHNEYYGALGIGSSESIGSSRSIIKANIYLSRFRIYQLIRNSVKSIAGMFSSPSDDGTLMSRMAENQSIEFKSDEYYAGITQFEENISELLDLAKQNKVPVILGTLASNLKDQPPFISEEKNKLPSAEKVFSKAKDELKNGNKSEADSLFRYAKDLDLLRFRAPEEINSVILSLGKKYNFPVIKIDSVFNHLSPDGIAGDNLFSDHLHPDLNGYKIMGRLFFESMQQNGYLPETETLYSELSVQDSLTLAHFNFSRLDSAASEYGIAILKNDWPFTDKRNKKNINEIIKPGTYVDSIAKQLVTGGIEWEAAQRAAASYYLKNKSEAEFEKQMNALISQYPHVMEYYDITAEGFIKLNNHEKAYPFLVKRFYIEENAFSAKWIGIINLSQKNNKEAISFLLKSLNFNGNDAQARFNLACAYSYEKQFALALNEVQKCLSIQPDYPAAKNLYMLLSSMSTGQ